MLSFVKYEDGVPTSWWSPHGPPLNYAVGCQQGRVYADELIAHMSEKSMPFLLIWVIAAMQGKNTGIEVGFIQRISEAAITSIQ